MAAEPLNEALEKLKNGGITITKQRKIIVESVINYKDRHFSADQLFREISGYHPDIGIATIFRTLPLLERSNLINRVKLTGATNYFELNNPLQHHQHHHLICTICNKVIEMNVDRLDLLEDQIGQDHGFAVQNHQLNFYGLCSDCQKH